MRAIVRAAVGAGILVGLAAAGGAQPARTIGIPMKVFKSPTCGCCQKWVEHVKAAGFAPTVQDLASLDATKTDAGVPPELRSCHTALVQGYVVEGHVPADVIQRMLKERPKVAGIAVPGMPIGSPGMEQGDRRDPYEIVSFTRDGKTAVYDKR